MCGLDSNPKSPLQEASRSLGTILNYNIRKSLNSPLLDSSVLSWSTCDHAVRQIVNGKCNTTNYPLSSPNCHITPSRQLPFCLLSNLPSSLLPSSRQIAIPISKLQCYALAKLRFYPHWSTCASMDRPLMFQCFRGSTASLYTFSDTCQTAFCIIMGDTVAIIQ